MQILCRIRATLFHRRLVLVVMNGRADHARLIGDGTRDRLANPPGSVRPEFKSSVRFELFDRSHQARVSFLDQITKIQSSIAIFFGDGYDETQVGIRHFLLGLEVVRLCLFRQAHRRVKIVDGHQQSVYDLVSVGLQLRSFVLIER